MIRFNTLRATGVALSLSLGLLAGCAAPTVPVPTATGTATTGEAGTPAAAPATPVQAASEPAPAALPAPAAVSATTLNGVASFRGEALSGYAVTVLDARTGAPVALKSDLAGVTGLAVLNQNLVTDAKGQFALQVVGLSAGQSLNVVVSKGDVKLESVVTSNLQSLGGAKKRSVLQVADQFTVTELTTAIAQVASGVLSTTRMLSAEQAAPILANLATKMASLSVQLEAAIATNPSFANEVVRPADDKNHDAVKALIANAGALKELTIAIAGMVSDIAKASAGENGNAELKLALSKVDFIGTVLTGSLKDDGFKLTNSLNGKEIDAKNADSNSLSSVTTQVTPKSSSQATGTPVSTWDELVDAVENQHVSSIRLTRDIEVTARDYQGYGVLKYDIERLYASAPLTINGGGHHLYGYDELTIYGNKVTLQSMKVNTRLSIRTFGLFETSAAYKIMDTEEIPNSVKLESVIFDKSGEYEGVGTLTLGEGYDYTLTGNTFYVGEDETGLRLEGTWKQAKVANFTGNQFHGQDNDFATGIAFEVIDEEDMVSTYSVLKTIPVRLESMKAFLTRTNSFDERTNSFDGFGEFYDIIEFSKG